MYRIVYETQYRTVGRDWQTRCAYPAPLTELEFAREVQDLEKWKDAEAVRLVSRVPPVETPYKVLRYWEAS